MRLPKVRELKEAIKSLFSPAYTSDFPRKPHIPYERFRGRPYFHEEDCTGCTACAQVCPAKAIEINDEIKGALAKRKLTVHWDICIFCGQCQANCLTAKGIMLSREFDLATTEKREDLKQTIEKEFVLCESCAEPIVPYDQYVWVAKKLGPLSFTNASLLLFYLRSIGLALKERIHPGPGSKPAAINRSTRIKTLCPRCRREAVLKS
ncbi:MAG: 4Fe-4S dicluster domain-containing protein [Candidatus Omnitrophota bacterium]|nr:4Fe-4S dicluster domain-containing protein [Candidatus Omnitrophota bacterium]